MSSSVQGGRVTKNTTTTTTARRRRVQHPKKTRASIKSQPQGHEYERNGSQCTSDQKYNKISYNIRKL